MRKKIVILAAACALSLGASSVSAQSTQGPMKGMDMKDMGHGAAKSVSHPGMKSDHNMMAMNDDMAAMKKMNTAMMAAKGATPDITFARKMLAHHQGAMDMAQIELKYGSDAEAKRMAQQMIDDQTKSKAELEAWLKSHGG